MPRTRSTGAYRAIDGEDAFPSPPWTRATSTATPKGGKPTRYARAYFAKPISGAIVTTATIGKICGTKAIIKNQDPQLVGGVGSGIPSPRILKTVKVGNKILNPISATCPDGKLKVHGPGRFEDGPRRKPKYRACTPKG